MPSFHSSRLRSCRAPQRGAPAAAKKDVCTATAAGLTTPRYRVTVDARTGTITLLAEGERRSRPVLSGLGETVVFDGASHRITDIRVMPVASGQVLARLRIEGRVRDATLAMLVTAYAALDRVDLDIHITKPASDAPQRLCHVFPLPGARSCVSIRQAP